MEERIIEEIVDMLRGLDGSMLEAIRNVLFRLTDQCPDVKGAGGRRYERGNHSPDHSGRAE